MTSKRRPEEWDGSELVKAAPLEVLPMEEILCDHDFNCRGVFTPFDVVDLADCIRAVGLLQPIVVRLYDRVPGKKYQIVFGHRRFVACELLRMTQIEARNLGRIPDEQAKRLNAIENIERKDLNIMQEAETIRRLFPPETPVNEMSRSLRKDSHWVRRRLLLLDAIYEVQRAATAGYIPEQVLYDIVKLPKKDQLERLNRCLAELSGDTIYYTAGSEAVAKAVIRDFKKPGVMGVPCDRSPKDALQLIITTLDASIIGLYPRLLGWCAGWISREQLVEEIKKITPIAEFRSGTEPNSNTTPKRDRSVGRNDPERMEIDRPFSE